MHIFLGTKVGDRKIFIAIAVNRHFSFHPGQQMANQSLMGCKLYLISVIKHLDPTMDTAIL